MPTGKVGVGMNGMKGKGEGKKGEKGHTGKSAKEGDVVGIEHVFAQGRLSDTVISNAILPDIAGNVTAVAASVVIPYAN